MLERGGLEGPRAAQQCDEPDEPRGYRLKEWRASGEPVLAEVGAPFTLSLGVAGYRSVRRPAPSGGIGRKAGRKWVVARGELNLARVLVTIGASVLVLSCAPRTELPRPAQERGAPPAEVDPPAPPAMAKPAVSIKLSPDEMSAIEELRRRGASIAVFVGAGDTLVSFPLGALERQWRRDGMFIPECGYSLQYAFTPHDTGPDMTDADLKHLERLPRLTRVDLGGTHVSGLALSAFRRKHPRTVVEHE